jgi:hypothetical protein
MSPVDEKNAVALGGVAATAQGGQSPNSVLQKNIYPPKSDFLISPGMIGVDLKPERNLLAEGVRANH